MSKVLNLSEIIQVWYIQNKIEKIESKRIMKQEKNIGS